MLCYIILKFKYSFVNLNNKIKNKLNMSIVLVDYRLNSFSECLGYMYTYIKIALPN